MENRRFEFTAAEMDALHSLKAQDAPPDGGFELGDAALAELDRMSQTLVVE